jgi:hypothetical protein
MNSIDIDRNDRFIESCLESRHKLLEEKKVLEKRLAEINGTLEYYDDYLVSHKHSKAGNLYNKHPATGTSFIGFKVPMWNEVIDLVKEASEIIPEMGMVGWDVALSSKGVLLVEANEYPGHDIYQLPVHRKDGTGILPKFENILKIK